MTISYSSMSEDTKKDIINKLYCQKKLSFADIAKKYDTYANRILRDAKKFQIPIRNKQEAQSNALQTGKHKHPTKGTQRDSSTKNKIGQAIIKNWENMSEQVLKDRRKAAKKLWDQKTEHEKQNLLTKANQKVREASKLGSKLEHFVLDYLLSKGYRVDFHKEQFLVNTKLQIDLFLPTINVAIEVDGPSHFAPVWGEDTLKRNIVYDQKKAGLIMGKGYKLIRIKQQKDYSKTRAYLICEKLISILSSIDTNGSNIIEIGD